MSSTALERALICAAMAAVIPAVGAKESHNRLSCDTQKVERAALTQSPKAVRRVSKHVLEVATTKGIQRFVDKPPHDVHEMAGTHWRYCGFDTQAKAHLIEMIDESAYSGALVLADTGQRLRAGHTVLFDPTSTKFLAVEQEAGMDGENWSVQDLTGRTVWKGYAGTVAKIDGVDMVASTFERPRWTRDGELTARFVCASSKPGGVITLVQESTGNWSWRGHGKCQ